MGHIILLIFASLPGIVVSQNKWVVNNDPVRAPEHFSTFEEAQTAATIFVELYANECFYFVIGGDTLRDSGDYQYTLQATNGCDSIVDLHLNIVTDPMYCGFLGGTPMIEATAAILANDPHQSDFCAGMTLTSDGIITSSNLEDIYFTAGDYVELMPGFAVELGARLQVDIGDCDN
ncbi:MAG: hypothetical protein IPL46_07240 [Saprospiraceae bacterium]|nr:hypothetical protein [Saprospiraceae bacterium]